MDQRQRGKAPSRGALDQIWHPGTQCSGAIRSTRAGGYAPTQPALPIIGPMRHNSGTLPVLLLLLSSAQAQTFLVDPGNGPGTNFTTLSAAIAAVPDGATLIVRAGNQPGFSVSNKGFTVLCEPGVVLTGPVSISSTGAGQDVTLRGMAWAAASSGNLLSLQSCAGPVLLDQLLMPPNLNIGNCGAPPFLPPCSWATGISATSCPQLHLHACDVGCTVSLSQCSAIVESCTLSGEDSGAIYWNAGLTQPSQGRSALNLSQATVQVAGNSILAGGNGNFGSAGAPGGYGISGLNSVLRVLDGRIDAPLIGGGAIAVLGNVRISPRVTFTNSSLVGTDIMPQLAGTSAPAGGTLSATTDTENGDLVILLVGFAGAPTGVAGFQDPFWLSPSTYFYAAVGTQTAPTPVSASLPVPAGPTFVGVRLNWQAACFGPVTGSQASNPVATLVH